MGSYLKVIDLTEKALKKLNLKKLCFYDFLNLIEPATSYEAYEVCSKDATFFIWALIRDKKIFNKQIFSNDGEDFFFVLKEKEIKKLAQELEKEIIKNKEKLNKATLYYSNVFLEGAKEFLEQENVESKIILWLE